EPRPSARVALTRARRGRTADPGFRPVPAPEVRSRISGSAFSGPLHPPNASGGAPQRARLAFYGRNPRIYQGIKDFRHNKFVIGARAGVRAWEPRAGPPLFNHLVREHVQLERDVESEGLRSLEVEHELEFRRLHHWQVGGLLTLEDAAGIGADQAIGFGIA